MSEDPAIWRKLFTDFTDWADRHDLSAAARTFALNLFCWPESNRAGIFWAPTDGIAAAARRPEAEMAEGRDELVAKGWCAYDHGGGVIAIRRWAERQTGGNPNMVRQAWKDAAQWARSKVYATWWAWCSGVLQLETSPLPRPKAYPVSVPTTDGVDATNPRVPPTRTPHAYPPRVPSADPPDARGVETPPQDTKTLRHKDTNSGSIAHPPAPAHTHTSAPVPAREAPAAAAAPAAPAARPVVVRAPTRDPWPEDASRAAADLWIALRRDEGVEPLGDVCEPFERAALMLRDKHRIPAGEVSRTLERIVELAHISPTVRASRHGDLFRDTFHLFGNPNPKGGGVPMADKLRRYLEDLAEADARARAREPAVSDEIPYEEERVMAEQAFDDEGYADWLRRNAHRAPPMAQEGAREASVPPGGGSGHEGPQKGPQWPSAMCELSDPRAGGSP